MNRLLTILLLLGATAHGQINNPPTSVNIVDSTATGRAVLTATNAAAAATAVGLGTNNDVSFATLNATIDAGESNSALFYSAIAFDDLRSENIVEQTRTNLGLGAINSPTFRGLTLDGGTVDDAVGLVMLNSSGPWSIFSIAVSDSPASDQVGVNLRLGSLYVQNDGRIYQKIGGDIGYDSQWGKLLYLDADGGATNARSSLGLATTNNVTFSNITASGTLTATGNVTMSGSDNLMPNATNAASASSLMTRALSDVRYLGEFWHAWRMSAYNTTNIPVSVFKTAPCVLYTNGQSAFYVEAFLDPSKYAGKTVRVLAYCRVDTTNGGNVQGAGRIAYLTNTAGGADPNFPLTTGGQTHGSFGVFTNANTDVFPVATSTNQYLVFTSNVGTISNNATMIIATFGFNRASTNTTFTNGNLYMQAVEVVVENP